MFKLANIAGPFLLTQKLDRLVANRLGGSILHAGFVDKVLEQYWNIFTSFAKRGQADGHHVQAVEEIFVETALTNGIFPVDIRSSDMFRVIYI